MKRHGNLLLIIICFIVLVIMNDALAKPVDHTSAAPAPTVISTPAPTPTPTPMPTPTPEQTPKIIDRYANVTMTKDERRDLAAIIYLESRNQCFEGQQAVAEVVLNRVIADNFPDTVNDVLYAGAGTKYEQFSTIGNVNTAEPTQVQYDAIAAALNGPEILPDDVVYFSRYPENDRVWGWIEDHAFCYQYVWE